MKPKKCETARCRKEAKKGRFCYSCQKEQYKQRHPVEYAFQVFRQNARRRQKPFELTLEDFKKFCYETEVLHGRGRTSDSWHIDRIDDTKGYTVDNIQVLTNAENVRKENRRRKVVAYDYQLQLGVVLDATYAARPVPKDCPF